MLTGATRADLSKEMVLNAVGEAPEKIWETPEHIINEEGNRGTPDNPARKGGFDVIWDLLVLLFQDDEEDEEDDYIKAVEAIQGRPTQKLRTFLIEFNEKYYKANILAGLAWSDSYKLNEFEEKGHVDAKTESLIILRTSD